MATITRNYSPPQTNLQSPPLTIILTVIIIVFFLVGFFSVIVCRCLMKSAFRRLNLLRTSPSANVVSNADIAANNGLDPCIIKSFPTFLYSTVKDLRKEKYGLECAICLVEFEDDSMLRHLTFCCHVFHQECIDFWLESHKTCPVCRGNLNSTQNETIALEEGAISIEIREDREEQEDREGNHNEVEKSLPKTSVVEQANEAEEYERERFSRSHSTGHSIARIRSEKEEDKYTLILPEHVKAKLIRGHHWTGSSTTYGEISRHKDCGFG